MSTRIKKLCGAFFLFGIVLLGSLVILEINTRPVSTTSNIQTFEVKQGESSEQIIANLKEANLVRSSFFTKVKKITNRTTRFYVGTYHLNQNWTTAEILAHMSKMDNVNDSNTVSLRFVEGSWAKDIAAVVESETNVKAQDLLKLWNDPKYVKKLINTYDHLPDAILKNDDAIVLLEGFLYPDTYDFYRETTAEAITEKIMSNGEQKYSEIKNRVKEQDLSLYEVVTLASIVEYEASKPKDMALVAGVFINRLNIDMKLQSSVTVCYSLYEFDDWTECESSKNNQFDSPYNTYVHKGLPPGPILNPSLKGIEAVLDYTPSDYLFFIADVYGDGTVYYSKDYEQHKKYIEKYLGGKK